MLQNPLVLMTLEASLAEGNGPRGLGDRAAATNPRGGVSEGGIEGQNRHLNGHKIWLKGPGAGNASGNRESKHQGNLAIADREWP